MLLKMKMFLNEHQTGQLATAITKHLENDGVNVGSGFEIEHLNDDYFGKKAAWYSWETDKNKLRTGYVFWTAHILEKGLEDITILD